jgi:AraC family transcriptional regulator
VNKPTPVKYARTRLLNNDVATIDEVIAHPRGAVRDTDTQLDHCALVLPLRGVFATHFSSRQHVVTTPGDSLWLEAGVPHWYSFPAGVGDQCLVLRWNKDAIAEFAPELSSLTTKDRARLDYNTPLGADATLTRSLLWHRLRNASIDVLETETMCVGLLGEILRARCDAPRLRARRTETQLRHRRRLHDAREQMALDPQRRWTLAALAEIAHMSSFHFAHVFKREFGVSAYEYALRLRLVAALDGVLDSRADLSMIALDAGFSSHSHFTAAFHRQFGTTPLALRSRVTRGRAVRSGKISTAGAAGPA